MRLLQTGREILDFTDFKLIVLEGERCIFLIKNEIERPLGFSSSKWGFHVAHLPYLPRTAVSPLTPPAWLGWGWGGLGVGRRWGLGGSVSHSFILSFIQARPETLLLCQILF